MELLLPEYFDGSAISARILSLGTFSGLISSACIMCLFLLFMPILNPYLILFNFQKEANHTQWQIVNDGVMGGRSTSELLLDEKGNGIFRGSVSLENNGGFASVRCGLTDLDISDYQQVRLRIKGDGKRYQFRVKANRQDRHSYIAYFETTGQWQDVQIALTDFYPSFRGMKLDMPNFPGESVEEFTFLIANKRAEDFELIIDQVWLE